MTPDEVIVTFITTLGFVIALCFLSNLAGKWFAALLNQVVK